MNQNFRKLFENLLAELRSVEAELIQIHDNTIDIEDWAQAAAIILDTRTKIQQIRKWIHDLQGIHNEIRQMFPVSEQFTSGNSSPNESAAPKRPASRPQDEAAAKPYAPPRAAAGEQPNYGMHNERPQNLYPSEPEINVQPNFGQNGERFEREPAGNPTYLNDQVWKKPPAKPVTPKASNGIHV